MIKGVCLSIKYETMIVNSGSISLDREVASER